MHFKIVKDIPVLFPVSGKRTGFSCGDGSVKQLFNYCTVPGYEEAIRRSGKSLREYLQFLGLDGIELLVYRSEPYMCSFEEETIGVHLRSWSCWYDLWKDNKERLFQIFGTEEALREYYGGTQKRAWLLQIKRNIQAALMEDPEYMVFHVEEVSPAEEYSWQFAHTDEEITKMFARVFNRIKKEIPQDRWALFENTWWPGLRLTDPALTEKFLTSLNFNNVGLMLDTGHLMNTNPDLQTEKEGVAYICKILKDLGELRNYVKGVHLSCSLSGDYQRKVPTLVPTLKNDARLLNHVCNIDQHRTFREPWIAEIFDLIEPEYVVHELYYDDFNRLAVQIEEQKQLIMKHIE